MCEHWWSELGHKTSITQARWPKCDEADTVMLHIGSYITNLEAVQRKRIDRLRTKKPISVCRCVLAVHEECALVQPIVVQETD